MSRSPIDATSVDIDPLVFRRVLGHFPTGVAAITSVGSDDQPLAMTVGSFTSVSLDPPLVAFLPSKTSTTWAQIKKAGFFCVNVLAAGQEVVCRSFAVKGGDKFGGVSWQPAGPGSPRIDDAVAWIDCDIEHVHDGGDHDIVIGRVRNLDVGDASLPLLFFQGGYGRFAPLSFAAGGEPDLVEQLRLVDLARPEMERIAAATGVECLASVLVKDELVIAARSGQPSGGRPSTRVGQRMPFVPPLGAVLAAWDNTIAERWISAAGSGVTAQARGRYQEMLSRVHDRGWSIGLGSGTHRELEIALGRTSVAAITAAERREVQNIIDKLGGEYEPEQVVTGGASMLRNFTVPVFGQPGSVLMTLAVYGLPGTSTSTEVDRYREELLRGAAAVSQAIAGA